MTTVDLQRFWARVDKTGSCWLWTGYLYANGYGRFQASKRKTAAHRVAYEAVVGPIPTGLEIDHLCRVRHCVNPAHLEPVTHRENQMRGLRGVLTTHCPHGHPYDEANTYRRRNGKRLCRACIKRRRNTQ